MGKSKAISMMGGPSEDDYQTRDDVDKLMRADEVHQDAGRHAKAVGRITGMAARLTGEVPKLTPRKSRRSSGRSGGR